MTVVVTLSTVECRNIRADVLADEATWIQSAFRRMKVHPWVDFIPGWHVRRRLQASVVLPPRWWPNHGAQAERGRVGRKQSLPIKATRDSAPSLGSFEDESCLDSGLDNSQSHW